MTGAVVPLPPNITRGTAAPALGAWLGTCARVPARGIPARMSSRRLESVTAGLATGGKHADGRFNEKDKQRASNADLSTLLFASHGLDMFPSYLSRWSISEVNALEARLESQLELVRHQKALLVGRTLASEGYVRSYVTENADTSLETVFVPEVVSILSRGGVAKQRAKFTQLLEQEDEEGWVFSFPLFTPEFCARLVAESASFREFEQVQGTGGPTRSTGAFGSAVLKHMGLGWLDEFLLDKVLNPAAALLYPAIHDRQQATLDWSHGYVASYRGKAVADIAGDSDDGDGDEYGDDDAAAAAAQPQNEAAQPRRRSSLAAHTDDSEVTLNVALTEGFTGGELRFRHLRGSLQEGATQGFSVLPAPGVAVVHMGRHLHEVLPVTAGERHQYIMWSRSNALRAMQCPCCWQNFRQGAQLRECVCGSAWN